MQQGRFGEAIAVLRAVHVPGDRDIGNLLMVCVLSALQDEPAQAPVFTAAAIGTEPLVSVIIPTRDRAEMLRDALDSVGRQTYARWEALVVNDGGVPVGVPDALSGRVSVIDLPERRGVAYARNAALREARGDVIAFLDDDDIFLPEHLAMLVAGLREGGTAFACTRSVGVEERLENGARVELRRGMPYEYRYSRALLLVRNLIPTANWGVRRECFARLGGFDETLACAEDWDMLLRISTVTALHSIPALTAEMRVRPAAADSVTQRIPLRPTCELLYRRYPSGGHPLIELGRSVYLESVG